MSQFLANDFTAQQALSRLSSVATTALREIVKPSTKVLRSELPVRTGRMKKSVSAFVQNNVKKKRGKPTIVAKVGLDKRKYDGVMSQGQVLGTEYGNEKGDTAHYAFRKSFSSLGKANKIRKEFIRALNIAAKKSAARVRKGRAPFTFIP